MWVEGRRSSKADQESTNLHFQGDTIVATSSNVTATGIYRVVTGSFPTAVNIIFAAGGEEWRVLAIIEIKDRTMKFCHFWREGESRPVKFEATTETVLAVLRKTAQ
jgi:hypothetical protein